MSKRGLSLEEKRTKVLDILQSSNTCFLLKDIEKLAVKAGVTQQSVKDVIQSLICDDLVSSDKRACCALQGFWLLRLVCAQNTSTTAHACPNALPNSWHERLLLEPEKHSRKQGSRDE